jgi:hypothetical protein
LIERRIVILISTVFLLSGFACTRADDSLKIVRSYNDAIIMAHRTGDTTKLADVAGEREARLVGVLVTTKRGVGLVLEATLERLDVLSARRTGPDSRLIEATEHWRYYDRPLQPGRSPGQIIQAVMKVQYECERSGNAWKVMKVNVLEHTFPDQKEIDKKG